MADKVYETFRDWEIYQDIIGLFDCEGTWNARQPQVDALTAQVDALTAQVAALKEQNENLERNVTGKHRHIRKLEESLKDVMPQLTAADAACATALMNKFIDALEDFADLDDDQRTARAAEVLLVEALAAWKVAKGGAK